MIINVFAKPKSPSKLLLTFVTCHQVDCPITFAIFIATYFLYIKTDMVILVRGDYKLGITAIAVFNPDD